MQTSKPFLFQFYVKLCRCAITCETLVELNKRTAVRVTNINGKILRMKNSCLGVTNVPIFVESNEALIIDVNSIK
jgi:hypothetical protein